MISFVTMSQIKAQPTADEAWAFYRRTFGPLARLAVNRHLLNRDEFDAILADGTVEKHLAVRPDASIVGMAVVTNDLMHWPLVSPEWFAHHHPGAYAQGDIWYVGFVGARSAGSDVFGGLLSSMTAGRRNTGVFFMDFCALNETRGIVELATRRLAAIDGRVRMEQVDHQSFWRATFDGTDTRAHL